MRQFAETGPACAGCDDTGAMPADLHLDPVALAEVSVRCRVLAERLGSVARAPCGAAEASPEFDDLRRVVDAATVELAALGAAAGAAASAAVEADVAARCALDRAGAGR